ncbi:DUF2867 domain-containing protein [Gordonia soli]|nr:DUF2867 domain-containing protein [Gordonia soli]
MSRTENPERGEILGAVGVDAAGVDVRNRSSLDADYIDHYELTTPIGAAPQDYARAMFGDVPTPGERFIWTGLLHITLSRGTSPDTIAGWRLAEETADWVRMEARSWFLTAHLVVRAVGDRLSLTTYIRYDRIVGRLAWTTLSGVHRSLVPGLLRDAARRVAQRA